MIRLGTTYDDVVNVALQNGGVDVDYVKVDAERGIEVLRRALAYKPVLLHDLPEPFWLNYEDPFGDPDHMARSRELVDTANSPWLSTGMGASAEPQEHRAGPFREAPADKLQTREKARSNIIKHGRQLKEWAGIPILLENYNYHATNAYEYVCEPDVVWEVLEAIDCGMLLDLAHAQISGYNLRWSSIKDYIAALPLDRVREIHLNHPIVAGHDQMFDMHQPVGPKDLELLGWVLERTPAEAVTIEASLPDEETLHSQVALLRNFISGR